MNFTPEFKHSLELLGNVNSISSLMPKWKWIETNNWFNFLGINLKQLQNMKTIHIIYSLALIAVFNFYGCEENDPPYEQLTTSKEGTNIFLAKANTGLESLEIFPADEDEKTTTLGAGFGGLGVPKNDITITLRIDETALDSINASRILNGEAKYELFPENSYSIDK